VRLPAEEAGSGELKITGVERTIFFSDAVVAIAITLLALDLHVPGGGTNAEFWRDMHQHLDDYIGFLVSFAVIGSHWLGHHHVFGWVARLSSGLARWNLLWLLMIVITPFATRVIVGDEAFAARFTLYALVQAVNSIFFILALYDIDRHQLARTGTPRTVFVGAYQQSFTVAGLFLVSIPIAFLTHWAYLCWVAIPVVMRLESPIAAWWRRARS
jgi:uncharacterized membrane protein